MMGLSKGLLGRTVARDLDVLAILQINSINKVSMIHFVNLYNSLSFRISKTYDQNLLLQCRHA